MARKKEVITLECTEAKSEGKPTSRYYLIRNKKGAEKLEIKKFNPFLGRHTVHRQKK
ncbi:MAG: 50S ribosomal protein L33 [Verrucomicrobiae bacterium]|nr:50S ribosomal protein L33 [Verrucomicrobiae bacterium]